jgi:hypothetical protein
VHNRNHGDKEKKTIVKMLFSKDSQRLCLMKKIFCKDSQIKKSCAKVLNYFASPSITKSFVSSWQKKRTKIKMANERIILGIDQEQL